MRAPLVRVFVTVVAAAAAVIGVRAAPQDGFRFKSGVELINVTATVTDESGRFVSGLRQEDFDVYEDGVLQDISHFSAERVPVSLGISLDTSGSMTPDKMSSARGAIDRFVFDLLGPEDELFFQQFAASPAIVQEWTTDRKAISRAAARADASGGTALYDAVAQAVPYADNGMNRKKALLVITDGNDTNSRTSASEVRQIIRESEVLVYALGVDGTESTTRYSPPTSGPLPIPFPGRGGRPGGRFPGGIRIPFPQIRIGGSGQRPGGGIWSRNGGERVNADALRQITDDTGGRTEIVRGFGDLDGATARIADELSRQYYIGYSSSGKKDGRWHTIRVEVRNRRVTVRARRGYVAS
jgi:VWFA-related protein